MEKIENAKKIVENRIILNAIAKTIEPEQFETDRNRAIELAEFWLREKKLNISNEQFKEIAVNILSQASEYLYLISIIKRN